MSEGQPPISLEQLAGIAAATSEQLPLPAVLEQEQVEEAAYRDGERAWRVRIADSVPVQLEYAEKYRVAQDCLARKLSPVEDDAAAWVGLLGALATTDDSAGLLAKLGITMNDVGRLGRQWKRRAQKDPEVGKTLAELAPDAKPPEKITAGPVELKPFPWTPKEKKAPAPKLDEDVLAEAAPISLDPLPVKRVLASFQVTDKAPAQPVPLAAPSRPAEPETSFHAWSIEHYARLAWELRQRPTEAESIMQRAGLTNVDERRQLHEHFRRRFDAEPGLRAQFEAWLAAATPAPAAKPRGAAGAEALANLGAEDAAVIARIKSAYRRGAVATADTVQADGGSAGSGTVNVHDDASEKPALPFEPGAAPAPIRATPLKKQSGKTVATPTPLGWTVERYARLCADLHSSGLSEAQVLAGEQLSPPLRQILDGYWQPRLRSEPELRAEWQRHANDRVSELRRR